MFKIPSPYFTDGYKLGHAEMLAPNTEYLYGTWIPRSTKHAPKGITKVVSFGQRMAVKWVNDEWNENFFSKPVDVAIQFGEDMSKYLGAEFRPDRFAALHKLGYLPVRVKALPEGIETNVNTPHATFVNTVPGFAWVTLYLETIFSSLLWKPATSATIALKYKRQAIEWVRKTDSDNIGLVPFMLHDFSARGLSPWDMISSGLGHATSFLGSDTLAVIPASRYFYGVKKKDMPIYSVNASEHSVSTTCIFTMGESKMLKYFMDKFPTGILSVVADTFDLWKLITEYLPQNKEQIMSRNGKLVVRPDSGDPVDIICGLNTTPGIETADSEFTNGLVNYWVEDGDEETERYTCKYPEYKGVVELLWEIFGGTVNEQGFKVLDPHIGAIYGDSITVDRQEEIYRRLASKGFAATNIILGIGSYTYQMNTRDTFGFAAKGSQFICDGESYEIYKDPITDDGTKKSLKGYVRVNKDYSVSTEVTKDEETQGLLEVILENGRLYNETTLDNVRQNIDLLSHTKELH